MLGMVLCWVKIKLCASWHVNFKNLISSTRFALSTFECLNNSIYFKHMIWIYETQNFQLWWSYVPSPSRTTKGVHNSMVIFQRKWLLLFWPNWEFDILKKIWLSGYLIIPPFIYNLWEFKTYFSSFFLIKFNDSRMINHVFKEYVFKNDYSIYY